MMAAFGKALAQKQHLILPAAPAAAGIDLKDSKGTSHGG
jgi:hypothetical protein